MIITNFEQKHAQTFTQLFAAYFSEIGAGVPEDIVRDKLIPHIFALEEKKTLRIDLAFSEDICIGFSIYQIDTLESDWCKRPGWGFIREFYIAPPYRRFGFGRKLAEHTEKALRNMGASGLYLTSDSGIPFWVSCGWRETREICSNELNILEK